jgi:hypothetical protein
MYKKITNTKYLTMSWNNAKIGHRGNIDASNMTGHYPDLAQRTSIKVNSMVQNVDLYHYYLSSLLLT